MNIEIADPIALIFDSVAGDPADDLVVLGGGVEPRSGIVDFEEIRVDLASALVSEPDGFGDFFGSDSLDSRVDFGDRSGWVEYEEGFYDDATEPFLFEFGEDLWFLFGS